MKRVRGRCAQNLFAALKSADGYHDSSQPADSALVFEGDQDTGAVLADLSSYTKVQMPTLHVRRKLGVWQTNSPSAHFKKCIKRFRKLETASAKNRKETRRFAGKD